VTGLDPGLWQQIIQHVIAEGGQVIRPWFSQLEPVALERGQLRIRVPGPKEESYCRKHAADLFTGAAQVATGRLVSAVFEVSAVDIEVPPIPDPQGRFESELPLGQDYTFGSFVTGPCNRLAHAASVAVAESPGKTYNPLFIHGSAGLGKTHLLQAVCQAVLDRGQTAISFLSCEMFVNHLIEAIETGRLHDFRYRYRHVDVLVVDDVQFLSNHDQTQEEFFHTFNTLYQSQKQIILSCDRPPAEIPHLEERLVSRFSWGLVAGIDRPGYETRVAIVHKKAAGRGIALPGDVACFIASTIDSNARELCSTDRSASPWPRTPSAASPPRPGERLRSNRSSTPSPPDTGFAWLTSRAASEPSPSACPARSACTSPAASRATASRRSVGTSAGATTRPSSMPTGPSNPSAETMSASTERSTGLPMRSARPRPEAGRAVGFLSELLRTRGGQPVGRRIGSGNFRHTLDLGRAPSVLAPNPKPGNRTISVGASDSFSTARPEPFLHTTSCRPTAS